MQSYYSLCQNLVINPGFECATDTCEKDQDGSQFGSHVCNWFASSSGTPDLFSTAARQGCFTQQPSTENPLQEDQPGAQVPHSGQRFAGIFTYGNTTGEPSEYREYISALLSAPLKIGSYYMVSMYISRARNMIYASNNLGVYFSDSPYEHEETSYPLSQYTPQIIDTTIVETIEWVKFCKIFKASSAATTINIGNFSNDESTQARLLQPAAIDSYYYNGYYFIDDVSVEPISSPDSLSLILAGNTSVCAGESTALSVSPHFDDIVWSIFPDTTRFVSYDSIFQPKPDLETTYWVRGAVCNVKVHDTVTVHVRPAPSITLGNDTTICAGGSKILQVPNIFVSYKWQDNSTSNSFEVTAAGRYMVTVQNKFGCIGSASVNVEYLSQPIVNLGRDTLACYSFGPLKALNDKSSYLWSTGSIDSVLTPTRPGTYSLTVTNQCGIASDSIQVSALGDISYPNVLTINGDGLNDKFRVLGVDDVKGIIEIFNRWGDSVYKNHQYANDWPVNVNTESGVYFFDLSYPGCPQNYKGWIQILR